MSKNLKKNKGIQSLKMLNEINSISEGAGLKENFVEEKVKKDNLHINFDKYTKRQLVVPTLLNDILKEAKSSYKINVSLNGYIVEALRKKMIEDKLLKE